MSTSSMRNAPDLADASCSKHSHSSVPGRLSGESIDISEFFHLPINLELHEEWEDCQSRASSVRFGDTATFPVKERSST